MIEHHSPSSLNLFCASPAMWVMEKVLKRRQPVGVPAHRGTAVEAGLACGLELPNIDPEECIKVARRKYDELTALSGDPRREKYGRSVEVMTLRALTELRPYGKPSKLQNYVEWRPEGLKLPIVGYSDFEWEDHGIVVDLKTTEALPSQIKVSHARQIALYVSRSDNTDARLCYVTPTKSAVYQPENVHEHLNALHRIALTVERFLSVSTDPQELAALVCPDLESFYWAPPEARQAAYEVFGV